MCGVERVEGATGRVGVREYAQGVGFQGVLDKAATRGMGDCFSIAIGERLIEVACQTNKIGVIRYGPQPLLEDRLCLSDRGVVGKVAGSKGPLLQGGVFGFTQQRSAKGVGGQKVREPGGAKDNSQAAPVLTMLMN